MSDTQPDPKRLAQIRAHVGRINSLAHRAVFALDTGSPDGLAVVADLAHASKSEADNIVTALLLASHDLRPGVRAAAASAMSFHPYGLLTERLSEMERTDPDITVRAAAISALDDMIDVRPCCLQCGSDAYDPKSALRLPASSNPHGAFVFWPVFCSPECAVEYALDRVRDDFDTNLAHECLSRGEFRRCSREDCDHCAEADAVGRTAPAPEPKPEEGPSRHRARRSKKAPASTHSATVPKC